MLTAPKLRAICVVVIQLACSVGGDYIGRLCTGGGPYSWGNAAPIQFKEATIRACIQYCRERSFIFAGITTQSFCACNNDLGGHQVCKTGDLSDLCSRGGSCSADSFYPCQFDQAMVCGGETWYSVYNSTSWGANLITKMSTRVVDVCSSDDGECGWECAMEMEGGRGGGGRSSGGGNAGVWGTNVYDIESSYCLTGQHSGKYPLGRRWTVRFHRTPSHTSAHSLRGSWSHGVMSQSKTSLNTFSVTKPLITRSMTLYGFVDRTDNTVTCQNYGDGMPYMAYLNNSRLVTPSNGKMPVSSLDDIIYCGIDEVTDYNLYPYINVPVVYQPIGNANVTHSSTLTFKEGQEGVISFYTSKLPSNGPYTVREASGALVVGPTWNTTVRINVSSFLPSRDTGYYKLFDGRGNWQGTVRVIEAQSVNAAIGNCNPIGSIPHPDGSCICVPPFGGDEICSQICQPNYLNQGTFGPKCARSFSTSQWKGMLVCAEDPFGCHCSSGWTGLDCTEECPNGTYGLDCKGTAADCNCAGGGGCNRITGACPSGCEWGWFDETCKKQGGYLLTSPYINYQSGSEVQIGWAAWVMGKDGGQIAPDGYYLEYKPVLEPASGYINTSDAMYPKGMPDYIITLTNLTKLVGYIARVRTVVNGVEMPTHSPLVVVEGK